MQFFEASFGEFVHGGNPTFEEIEGIANAKKKKSAEENKTAHENNAKAEEEAKARAIEEAAKTEAEAALNNDSDDFFDNFWRNQQKYHDDSQGQDDSNEKKD